MLTYEEFTTWEPLGGLPQNFPRYNNFPLNFHPKAHTYRNREAIKRFKNEHPELDVKLCTMVLQTWQDTEGPISPEERRKILSGIEPELYKAYEIIKGYGYSDEELFT